VVAELNLCARRQSSVGAFRRIPMATVTPDDFHPSAASSPGPLLTSSPLLPDEDEQPALKYDAGVDGRDCKWRSPSPNI
jgi:hypothetical protein